MFRQPNSNVVFMNNNMHNNNRPFNNLNNMPMIPQSINVRNNMVNNNPFQNQSGTTTLKRDLKLNKIVAIGSMLPMNNCREIYTDKEYDVITEICVTALKAEVENIAKFCSEKIKEKIKGQWFVLVQEVKDNNSEFSFTKINFKNILSFQYSDKIFYISCLNR